MKGCNSITLCPAQMIEIVQEWVDATIATKPAVASVKAQGDLFVVSITERLEESAYLPYPMKEDRS